MRLGILGGTFDPPHLAHLILAAEAQAQLELEQVLWVLTPDPPHKKDRTISPLPLRLELLRVALAGNPAFAISTVDIDRPSPHYALDTVRLLAEIYPGAELIYLMGGDSLHDLPTWHKPAEFLSACTALGVLRRLGDQVDLDQLELDLPGITAKVSWIYAPLLEISASNIRQRAAQGRPYRYYLLPAVYDLIEQYGLYKNSS